jgi:maleamate amidohydrolase
MTTGENEVFARQGFGQKLGFGKRPALVVIDFTNGFADPSVLGGGNIADAVRQTVGLLAQCRAAAMPIAFTRIVYAADGSDHGLFSIKLPANRTLTPDAAVSQIVPALAPLPGELILDKRYPSAFFGTHFPTWLNVNQVDTLIVTGCVTSGCVRATVVDAISYGYRPMVVRDCVGDRAIAAHEASLFDMEQKYADVMGSDEVAAIIAAGG